MTPAIDVLNGKNSRTVVLSSATDFGAYRRTVRDCLGRVVDSGQTRLTPGVHVFDVPVSGLLSLERIDPGS